MTNVLWTCPYCNRACTLQGSDIKYLTDKVTLSKDHGAVYGNIQFKICPNPECRKISIVSRIWQYRGSPGCLDRRQGIISGMLIRVSDHAAACLYG